MSVSGEFSKDFPYLWGTLDKGSATRNATKEDRTEGMVHEIDKLFIKGHGIKTFLSTWNCLIEGERADLTAAIHSYGGRKALSAMFMTLQEEDSRNYRKRRREAYLHEAMTLDDAWFAFAVDTKEWVKMIRFMEAIVDAQSRGSHGGKTAEEWSAICETLQADLDESKRVEGELEETLQHYGKVINRTMDLLTRTIQLDMNMATDEVRKDLGDITRVAQSIENHLKDLGEIMRVAKSIEHHELSTIR